MSMISNLRDRLREAADSLEDYYEDKQNEEVLLLREAAYTIESLSEKIRICDVTKNKVVSNLRTAIQDYLNDTETATQMEEAITNAIRFIEDNFVESEDDE